jgi:hypothetical protein
MYIKMNTPYTYLIGWSDLNRWYYGVRYSKNCHPTDLWNPYKTSSKIVLKFIKDHGEPDIRIVRRTFNSVNEARVWEHRVLLKLNVINKEKWLNGHNTIAFDITLVPKGDQHWTRKNPEKWAKIQKFRKYQKGEMHWTNQKTASAQQHRTRMNSEMNPNNFLHNKILRSEKLKIDNPVNLPGVKNKIKETLTGYKHPRKICEHCGKDVADSIYTRWHGTKCKNLG